MAVNKQILFNSRPTDEVSPGNFRFAEAPLPKAGEGEIVVRHHFLSLDPYMRGRLNDAKSYAKPQEIGAVMGGGVVGEVIEFVTPNSRAASSSSAPAAGSIFLQAMGPVGASSMRN